MTLVLDSSVVVKWFVQEPGTDQAKALRVSPIAVPDLILPECLRVFGEKTRRREFQQGDAIAAVESLKTFGFDVHGSLSLTNLALHYCLLLNLGASECFYLALSERLGAPLITADGGMIEKVRSTSAHRLRVYGLDETATGVLP